MAEIRDDAFRQIPAMALLRRRFPLSGAVTEEDVHERPKRGRDGRCILSLEERLRYYPSLLEAELARRSQCLLAHPTLGPSLGDPSVSPGRPKPKPETHHHIVPEHPLAGFMVGMTIEGCL